MMFRRDDNPDAHPFGPVLLVKHIAQSLKSNKSAKTRHVVEYGDVTTEVDKQYVDDCISDGNMELVRWYRDNGTLVLIYHWTN